MMGSETYIARTKVEPTPEVMADGTKSAAAATAGAGARVNLDGF